MIDVHAHIIFDVDDGAKSLEESIAIIQEEIDQGITDIICTPHFRPGMFETRSAKCREQFNILVDEVKKRQLPINLYLGREVYYSQRVIGMIQRNHLLHINNLKIVLLEFSYTQEADIEEIIFHLKCKGYQVIVAHIERYNYIKDVDYLYRLKNYDALIQVNASTICGVDGIKQKAKVLKYIKNGLVDFVASDIHYSRKNYMKKAYETIVKKFGIEIAEKLFITNAQKLIVSNEEFVAND